MKGIEIEFIEAKLDYEENLENGGEKK